MIKWIDTWGSEADFCSKCPSCKGTGWLTSARRCFCWYIYKASLRLWGCAFPRAYLAYHMEPAYPYSQSLSDVAKEFYPASTIWDMASADEEAINYFLDNWEEVRKQGLSLFIYGPKGCGKTAFATSIAIEITKRSLRSDGSGWDGSWVPSFICCDAIYEAVALRSRVTSELIERAMDADFLVLDDLRIQGQGVIASDASERIHRILQHRSYNNLPTIITANKVGNAADFQPNAVTGFLGIASTIPDRFGRYRMIQLTNDVIRSEPKWSVL